MIYRTLPILFLFFLVIGSPIAWEVSGQESDIDEDTAVDIPIMNFIELDQYLNSLNYDKLVVNFWATWCKPCVEELHHFQQLQDDYSDQDVKVILVSLDFVKGLESRLLPFLDRHDIEAEVIVLNDPNANEWINKVSEQWSGAIPATWFISDEKTFFYEGMYHDYASLINHLNSFNQ